VRDASSEALLGPADRAKADERVAPDLSTVRVQDGRDGAPCLHETRDVGADEVAVAVEVGVWGTGLLTTLVGGG
jgi:hypothetical protein